MSSKLSVETANQFLARAFSHKEEAGASVADMAEGRCVMRLQANQTHLRPGGYISGPTQMALADSAAYMAVMSLIGIEPMAVTSNLNINFLRPCVGNALLADAKIMKLGRTLAVIEVDLRAEGSDKTSSHAVITYSIPLERSNLDEFAGI